MIKNPIEQFDLKWEYSTEFANALRTEVGRIFYELLKEHPRKTDVCEGLSIVNLYRDELSDDYLAAEKTEIESWKSFQRLVGYAMIGRHAMGKGI